MTRCEGPPSVCGCPLCVAGRSCAPGMCWAPPLCEAMDDYKAAWERVREENERLRAAASWLLKCHDDVERKVPVRNYDEAWEGLRHAVADVLVVCSECRQPLDSLGCQAGGGHRDSVFKGTTEYEALRATATPLINFQTQPEGS